MSIMLSISVLFSCSLKSKRKDATSQTWLIHRHSKDKIHSGAGLTSVIFFWILSSCSVLFCLIVFVFCTSNSFWLFSMPTLRLRATPTRELSSFTAWQRRPGRNQRVQITLWKVFISILSHFMLLLHCISEGNIVFFTALYLSDSFSYFSD